MPALKLLIAALLVSAVAASLTGVCENLLWVPLSWAFAARGLCRLGVESCMRVRIWADFPCRRSRLSRVHVALCLQLPCPAWKSAATRRVSADFVACSGDCSEVQPGGGAWLCLLFNSVCVNVLLTLCPACSCCARRHRGT